ncbi:MAG TPA: ferredoxin-type protein NapF [Gammaproteobacteria bacterium]|nr:ferredoxin-type protein NapF [Gammaproteobacteria bacterium]
MQFLRGDIAGRSAPLRPPWALAEALFTTRCTRCGDCIDACPTGILGKGRGGFPQLDFSRGECLFCDECSGACTPGALRKAPGRAPWTLKVSLAAETCIAYHGVECRACADPCESRAIRMRPRIGGVALPDIDLSTCNGCGACYAPCPVQALRIQPLRCEETA